MGPLMPFCRPSRWNIGATAKKADSACERRHSCDPATETMTVRCVCMQAFGLPVVPDVYGSMQRSSGALRCGVGARACASASLQRVMPRGRAWPSQRRLTHSGVS